MCQALELIGENFHGSFKPIGIKGGCILMFINYEGVKGSENNKLEPRRELLSIKCERMPFIRMAAGPKWISHLEP